MNTIKCITSCMLMLLASLCTILPVSADSDLFVEADVQQRLESMYSSVELKFTPEVRKRIKQYTIQQRDASELLLGRISMYFPLFERKLRERGLPDDLKYLAVIESGLKPHARSGAGAVGLWQFMKPTARMQGLKISKYVDERRDPEASTDAALDYLEYLYGKFGDWTLAMAAYNCGPGNMRKAIRKAGSKDFWKVKKYLPRETRQYIPKFIAMSYLMNYYYSHDLTPELPHNDFLNTSTSQISESVNLKALSKELSLDLEMVQWLNPTYIRNYIPGEGNYKLTLPTAQMMVFVEKRNMQPVILYSHVNGRMSQISKRNILLDMPQLPSHTLSAYAVIDSGWKNQALHIESPSISPIVSYRSRKLVFYTLKRKQSLSQVAKQFAMSLDELIDMNKFDSDNLPVPGDAIMVVAE